MKIYRAVVRGQFDKPDDATTASLLERQDDHHYLKSAFTKQGTLAYDRLLVAFNVRFELRRKDDENNHEDALKQLALVAATDLLNAYGYPHKKLRANITDMADMWVDR